MDSGKKGLLNQVLECTQAALEMDSDYSDKDEILLGLVDAAEMVVQIPKKRKRLWKKPCRTDRDEKGSLKFLKNDLLKDDPSSYQNYLRMNKTKFNALLNLIRPDIERGNTHMREAITAEEKLALTLRFLATGESFMSMNYQTRLSTTFISQTVPEVCKALWRRLKGTHLKFPNSSMEWDAIAKDFAIKWQFPNCLGALDVKHIEFRPPRSEGAYYRNYKGTNSIILLALVDANLRFVFVDVGCNGRVSDEDVLEISQLQKVLDDGLHLPKDATVGSSSCLPYVIVADDDFPLQRHIMKPYPYQNISKQNKIFNKRVSRARHVVEHAFGVMSNRFRLFQNAMNLKVDTVEIITLACCALHNFLIDVDESYVTNYQQTEVAKETATPESLEMAYNPSEGEAENIRQTFTEYFNGEGQLD